MSGNYKYQHYFGAGDNQPSTSSQFENTPMAQSSGGSSFRQSATANSSTSPGASKMMTSYNELQVTNPFSHHSTSPLSDSLLLALRRSRPNTRLFRALFQYIPIRDSPNENPHLELPLQTGDYVLVHGQMDEDQFYFGETLNGKTGLVPSNYVERVPDHVLLQNASRAPSPVSGGGGGGGIRSCSLTNLACCEPSTSNSGIGIGGGCAGATTNQRLATISAGSTIQPGFIPYSEQQQQLPSTSFSSMHIPYSSNINSGTNNWYNLSSTLQRPESPSFALNVPLHHTQILHDFTDSQFAPLPDSVCPYPPVDVSKVTVQEMRQPDQPRVPFPRELTVEKKLSRSAVISWLPPEDKLIVVSQYHVCADGVVKAVVPGAYKCKALIEDLNLDKSVNISVRAVTEHGHSPDAACTIALGTEAPVAPQRVRVTSITPISACLSWYPSNSNAEHVILLNAIKVGVCPPSVFQVQLQGLSPSTIYRVSVRTKHPKAVLEQRPVERCVDFKTLPKIGLPDPPSHVQVEVGPQPGTLLISWKPVTAQPKPPSRAAVHSYLVFADGQNIAQVPSATADHVLLRLADFADDPPIFITIRTRTREGAISADSNVVRVPRGISATNPNVLASSREHLPFSSSIAVNTATGPLTTTSLPNSLIGNIVGSQSHNPDFLQSAMNTLAMSYGLPQQHTSAISSGSAPSGLLTTLPLSHQQQQSMSAQQQQQLHQLQQQHQQAAMHSQIYNTGYPMTQSAMLPSNQAAANIYGTGISQSTGPLLNGANNAAKLADWKQQQQSAATAAAAAAAAVVAAHQQQQNQPSSQYYTFHPKSLFKEFTGADDKPSVLEMENNYLLKHRQQQREREMASMDRYGTLGGSSTLNRYDYYGGRRGHLRGQYSYDDYSTGMSSSGRPLIMAGGRKPTAIPPRLSRVRSEELLGTRSEPDLRPLAITEDDENCRLFVALFDYDHLMSPNPNAQQEELSFRKHQLIKVYGDVDADGFYRGLIGRRFGLVPSNMVIEIAKDDIMPQRRRSDAYPVEPAIRRTRWGSIKSRSYDHAGDRRRIIPGQTYNTPSHAHMGGPSVIPGAPMYSSLDRREHSLPPYRYHNRPNYEGPQPASARTYGVPPRNTYGYTSARDYPPRDSAREYPPRDPHYEQPPVPEIYEGGPVREYRRGVSGSVGGEDYGRDTYQWDYPNEQREMREGGGRGDYRYDHPPYEDDRYPPPVQQRPALRREYPRYPEQQQQQQAGQWAGMRDPYDIPQQQLPPQQQQQPPSSQQPPQGRYGAPPPQQQQQQTPGLDDKLSRLNGEPSQFRKLIAKYDYDPKICSPNPDAEQVELTFRQGDMIIVYGDMDDDGFYLGELNGVKGMVPSNFLQIPGANQIGAPPNAMQQQQSMQQPMGSMGQQQPQSIMAGNSGGGLMDMLPPGAPRPKGVAFSEPNKKPVPIRQTSQTSNKISATGTMSAATGAAGSTSAMASKTPKISTSGAAGKTLAKKSSDLGQKTAATSAARKSSQAAKKVEGKKK